MKKILTMLACVAMMLMAVSCSSKDSTADEPDYQLVGSWSMTDAKISLLNLSLPVDDVTLNSDKTGVIAYKNLAGTAETAAFAWTVEGNELLITDVNNELPSLFTDYAVDTELRLKISNYTGSAFDVNGTINVKQDDVTVPVVVSGHFTKK